MDEKIYYKEISKIIKCGKYDLQHCVKVDQENISDYKEANWLANNIAKKLADYFEKEDTGIKMWKPFKFSTLFLFNRKQFLKDCGVD